MKIFLNQLKVSIQLVLVMLVFFLISDQVVLATCQRVTQPALDCAPVTHVENCSNDWTGSVGTAVYSCASYETCGGYGCYWHDYICDQPCGAPGGGGGGAQAPLCYAGEVFTYDVPDVYECLGSDGACKEGGDGRPGGKTGFSDCRQSSPSDDCGCTMLRPYKCHIAHCIEPCSCTSAPGACGDPGGTAPANSCGYENQVQVKTCNPANCEPNTCTANLACLWPGRVQGQKVLVGRL